jgi:chloramphenicol-sensitive protein RarD
MTSDLGRARAGLLSGIAAYFLWGVLPLYFKAIAHVASTEIVAHRVIWSLLLLGALATIWGKWGGIRRGLASARVMLALAATALLIGTNWLIYIWAVVSGHVLEGSLGYFLNPLVNVLMGVVVLKERLSRGQAAAVALAGAGVAVLALGAGEGLWISLTLAASFATYGLLRKVTPVDSLEGLSIETAFLAPLGLAWIIWLTAQGQGSFGRIDLPTDVMLVLGGAVTAVPLLLFTAAAKRLPFSTLGFLQYIAPSLQFLLAIFVFGERMTGAHIICFAAIWTALLIFAWEGLRLGRAASRERSEADARAAAAASAACVEPRGAP